MFTLMDLLKALQEIRDKDANLLTQATTFYDGESTWDMCLVNVYGNDRILFMCAMGETDDNTVWVDAG